jgi:hypothetical protein
MEASLPVVILVTLLSVFQLDTIRLFLAPMSGIRACRSIFHSRAMVSEVAAMILDKRRALICAAVVSLAAASGGASATQVYPGCAEPGPIGKVWYVDPVNGKTPADGGAGSKTAPWNSLQGVVGSTKQPGYSHPMLSTVPYDHYPRPNAEGKRIYADGPGGDPTRVQPGDEILLMSGQYGDVFIGIYGASVANPAFVTIAAAPGQTPVLSTLAAVSSSRFVFSGLKIQSLGLGASGRGLVTIGDWGAAVPASNLILDHLTVSAADPSVYATWTQPQWAANTRIGILVNGRNTTCVSIVDSHITANHFGLGVFADNMLVTGNEIDRFGDDGIDYAASNVSITHNYIHDPVDFNIGAHMDGMQGSPGWSTNVLIDSNRVIRQTDPKAPFPTDLQGIDAFNGDWTKLTVSNNVVVTSACWGIGYASVHGGMIVNNTALDDGSNVGTKNKAGNIVCRPWIGVGDKSHEGSSSNDLTVRNNIANFFRVVGVGPTVTMDHNICLVMDGKCPIATTPGGKLKMVSTPGEYNGRNIIERRGSAGMFVDFDPAKFAFDVRLRSGALAIGAGNPAGAPPVDITGAPRGSRIDIGAYQYGADQ